MWSALVKLLDPSACETWSCAEIYFEMKANTGRCAWSVDNVRGASWRSLYYVAAPSECISATHLSGGNGICAPDNGGQSEASFWQGCYAPHLILIKIRRNLRISQTASNKENIGKGHAGGHSTGKWWSNTIKVEFTPKKRRGDPQRRGQDFKWIWAPSTEAGRPTLSTLQGPLWRGDTYV